MTAARRVRLHSCRVHDVVCMPADTDADPNPANAKSFSVDEADYMEDDGALSEDARTGDDGADESDDVGDSDDDVAISAGPLELTEEDAMIIHQRNPNMQFSVRERDYMDEMHWHMHDMGSDDEGSEDEYHVLESNQGAMHALRV